MSQRALVQFSEFAVFSVSDNEPGGPTPLGQFSADGPVDYVDTDTRAHIRSLFRIDVPADASARQIENAAVAAAIASQPVGFNLAESNVVILALDRG
jgi:hypothetical protein